MKKVIVYLSFLVALVAVYTTATAQTAEAFRKDFEQYNINADDWLDGIEIDACKCKSYDVNNDKYITFEEFKAGRKAGKITPAPKNTTPATNGGYPGSNSNAQTSPPSSNATLPTYTTNALIQKAPGESSVSYINRIWSFGKSKGWASSVMENTLATYLRSLTEDQQELLVHNINAANTTSARFFVLKSLMAGDQWETLNQFITDLNQHTEAEQQELCIISTPKTIIQQWQLSCSVTTVQAYVADLSPRYCFQVKKINNYNVATNDPNHPMAQQQKQFLEKYGGTATPRGDNSVSTGIGLLGPINEFVGAILRVKFQAIQITDPLPSVLPIIRHELDKGINVPLHITFLPSETPHFIMALKYKYEAGQFHYMIYDPWEGQCNYVSESNLLQGSLSPVLTSWKVKIGWYFPSTPL